MFTTGGFEFTSRRPHSPHPDDEVWATRQPIARFSGSPCGCSSYARGGSSSRVSNLTPLPSTDGTHLGTQISRSWYLSGHRSYQGSQEGLETDFETGSTERMESLVSGLLQDEGWDYQNSFPVLASEVSRGTNNNISCSGHSPEIQELQDQFQSNSTFSRTTDDQGFDRVSGNKVSAGGRFPSTEMFPHQILNAHESALSWSRSADNVRLNGFPRSQQNVNPTMIHEFQEQVAKISLRDIEREYASQKKLEEMEAGNRESATEPHVKKSIEATRAPNVYEDSAADVGQLAEREHLFNPEAVVRDLRAIANSIEQTSFLEGNTSLRTDEAFMGMCKWLCQQGCPTSNTELGKVKTDIREGNGVRSHAQNIDLTDSSPALRHVWSQWTSGPDSSSPRPTFESNNFVFPAFSTVCSSAAAVVRSAASGPSSPGPRQQTSCLRGPRKPDEKPDGYIRNANLPPKLKTSPCRKAGSPLTSRGADHNMKVKFTSVAGFHPRTQPSASPPIKCARNGNSALATISSAKEFRSFQALLQKQKSSKYYAAFACHNAGSADRSAVQLQNIRKTKDLIAQGAKSISILLKRENSAFCGKSSYPASSSLDDSAPVSTGSRLLSPIRRQLLNKSADTPQLIPIDRSALEVNVCNQGQFKTELCNNWQATQYCPYGDLCRFAHGVEQLRCVLRHPRYKTIPCRMIMHNKACIYGHRCHFRHSLTTEELSLISVIDVLDDSVNERSPS